MEMYFVFFIIDHGVLKFSYYLSKIYNSNETECETIIASLEMVISLDIISINVYNDFQLVVHQISGSYKILKVKLIHYYKHIIFFLDGNS